MHTTQLTTHSLQFVTPITTVVVVVTFPCCTDAATVHAGELTWLAACAIIRNAVFVVGQVPPTF